MWAGWKGWPLEQKLAHVLLLHQGADSMEMGPRCRVVVGGCLSHQARSCRVDREGFSGEALCQPGLGLSSPVVEFSFSVA